MLRNIKHPHLNPIVSGGQVTSAGTAATRDIGGGDFSASSSASSVVTLTRKERPPRRAGIVIASAGDAIANGGYAIYNTDPATGSVVVKTLGAAGAADDGTFDFLALDYLASTTDRLSPQSLLRATSSRMRWIVGRINATTAIDLGTGSFSSVTKASSIFTVNFKNAFSRTPLIFTLPFGAAQKSSRVTSKSASSCTVATFDVNEAAEDNTFNILAVGWQARDDDWGGNAIVQIDKRSPRIECFRVNGTGTAAIVTGSTDASLTDNGTGDYTLTWTKPFARNCAAFATAKAGRIQTTINSTTAGRFLTFNAAGAAADDEFCVLVVGFDDGSEY